MGSTTCKSESISKTIGSKYKTSKLIDVKALNDVYSSPYSAFLKFLSVLFASLFIWAIVLYLICDNKKLNKETTEGSILQDISVTNFLHLHTKILTHRLIIKIHKFVSIYKK